MFKDWKEYRDYLTEKLLDESQVDRFKDKFTRMDEKYGEIAEISGMYKVQVSCILANDIDWVKLGNWESNPNVIVWRRWKRTGETSRKGHNRFIPC